MSLYSVASRAYAAMFPPPDLYSDRLMLSTALLCLSALPVTTAQDETPWLDLTFAEARERAAAEQKPLFAYFYAPYEKNCDHLDATVWSNGGVVDHLRSKTIPVRIDTSRSRGICNDYDVTLNATLVWISPEGVEMDRLVHDGKKNSTYFLEISHLVLDGESDLQHVAADVEANPYDGLKRVWLARKFESRGRTRHAVEQYLWAFDNCTAPEFEEHRRGDLLFAVRQLFQGTPAVTEMESRANQGSLLVKQGPEAIRETLGPEASDADVQAALKRTAADVASIRWVLEDLSANLELFDDLEGLPHARTAREAILPWTADMLVKAKRYDDIVDSIADLDAYFERMYVEFEHRHERLKTELPKRRHWQALARALDGIGKQFGPVFAALLGVGKVDAAETYARRLLELTDSSDPWVVVLQRAGQVRETELVQKLAAEGLEKFAKGTRDHNRINKMLRTFGGGE